MYAVFLGVEKIHRCEFGRGDFAVGKKWIYGEL
jgi:hypothetical protein